MKTSSLNKTLLFVGTALLALVAPVVASAQTSITPDSSSPSINMTTPESPVVPVSPETPVVPGVSTPAAPTTATAPTTMPSTIPMMSTTGGGSTSDASSDPAVSAVLDRLKQDSTPLSISDMSAAQDALARLNLLNEIEQKLSQIEETRLKRQYGAFPMSAMPIPGMEGTGGGTSLPPMANSMAFSSLNKTASDKPEIVSISGAGGTYRAIIKVDGRDVTAKSGTTLPDGSKVTSITSSGVSVSKKGKTTKLPFLQADTK